MTIPLSENDKVYDGITNHRINFENVYEKLSAAHDLRTGYHGALRFESSDETASPDVPNVKLLYNEKRKGALQLIDGVGKAKEIVFWGGEFRPGIIYNKFGDQILKNVAYTLLDRGKIRKIEIAGMGASITTLPKTKDGRRTWRLNYDKQDITKEAEWSIQFFVAESNLRTRVQASPFRTEDSGGKIRIFLESDTRESLPYNLIILNWVKYV